MMGAAVAVGFGAALSVGGCDAEMGSVGSAGAPGGGGEVARAETSAVKAEVGVDVSAGSSGDRGEVVTAGLAAASEAVLPVVVLEAMEPMEAGLVAFQSELRRQVLVSNTSRHPVSLSLGKVTCGCASASFDSSYLAPGETTFLTVSIDVNVPGPQVQSVEVIAREAADEGEGREARQTVSVSYEADQTYEVYPRELRVSGTLGAPVRATVYLTAFDGSGVRPTGVSTVEGTADAGGPGVRWRVLSIKDGGERSRGRVWRMELVGETASVEGVRTGRLLIETSETGDFSSWPLETTVRVRPAVSLSPSAMVLRAGETARVAIRAAEGVRVVGATVVQHEDGDGGAAPAASARVELGAGGCVAVIEGVEVGAASIALEVSYVVETGGEGAAPSARGVEDGLNGGAAVGEGALATVKTTRQTVKVHVIGG